MDILKNIFWKRSIISRINCEMVSSVIPQLSDPGHLLTRIALKQIQIYYKLFLVFIDQIYTLIKTECLYICWLVRFCNLIFVFTHEIIHEPIFQFV